MTKGRGSWEKPKRKQFFPPFALVKSLSAAPASPDYGQRLPWLKTSLKSI